MRADHYWINMNKIIREETLKGNNCEICKEYNKYYHDLRHWIFLLSFICENRNYSNENRTFLLESFDYDNKLYEIEESKTLPEEVKNEMQQAFRYMQETAKALLFDDGFLLKSKNTFTRSGVVHLRNVQFAFLKAQKVLCGKIKKLCAEYHYLDLYTLY
ncbi:MAG: hypothetical protein IJO24_07050 [Clostridia bacterium]|nr:hypothetical protein [Clostridia bacterium]